MQYNITYRKKDKGIQFIISYKDNERKWRQKSKQGFQSSKEAKSAAQSEVRDLEKSLELKASLNAEYDGITFGQYTKIFIEHEKLYKEPNTINHYNLTFNAFKDLNSLLLNKISNIDIQKCIDELVKLDRSEATIAGFLSSLHYTFNCALKKNKIITENPVKDIEVKVQKDKHDKIALTKSQLFDLLNKIKNKKFCLMSMVAAKCGPRISEIIGLTWDDIDFKNSMMSINKQWKRNKSGIYTFGTLKSKNSKREVPIPSNLLQELKLYKNSQKVIDFNARIFNYNTREQISSALCHTYRRAGYKISVHELRHTYGTMLIANGLDFKTVAKLMGNDVKQVFDTYSHVTEDMLNNAKDLINKFL